MKKRLLLFFSVCFAGLTLLASSPKYEMRAVWLTTNWGLDWPSRPMHTPVDARRQQQEFVEILDRFFEKHPDIRHIVVFNSRSYIVAEYLQAHGMDDRILLGFDPLERNVAAMKAGYIEYIIAQKCGTQAYRGVKALCNYFVFKTSPSVQDNYMSMEILTAENVNYYTDLPAE